MKNISIKWTFVLGILSGLLLSGVIMLVAPWIKGNATLLSTSVPLADAHSYSVNYRKVKGYCGLFPKSTANYFELAKASSNAGHTNQIDDLMSILNKFNSSYASAVRVYFGKKSDNTRIDDDYIIMVTGVDNSGYEFNSSIFSVDGILDCPEKCDFLRKDNSILFGDDYPKSTNACN